ncbi:MAG: hypothetical protein H6716_24055 [Polyangiaceae bacterium]|nr:hypothetical protein [Polyangiaceae bacterium]
MTTTPILDLAESLLRKGELSYRRLDDRSALITKLTASHASYHCVLRSNEEAGMLRVTVSSPTNIPETQRAVAAEFVCRANFGMPMGNFDLDVSDGEVLFRMVAARRSPEVFSLGAVELLFIMAVRCMDRYYPGLMAISFGGRSAAEAVEAVEAGD